MNNLKTSRVSQEAIVTADEVKDILIMYNIGKKPLAKLLGWGETTIIRYIEGDIPTIEYSQKLKQIKDDPNYYYDILLKNEDKLTTVAFKKSRKAVLNILMKSKINLVSQYIINQANGEITPRRVQAVLFYAQVVSLGIYGVQLFEEECRESYNDMPFINLYENMKKNGTKVIDIKMDALTKREKEILDSVYETFEWYGPKAIHTLAELEKKDYVTLLLEKNKTISIEALKQEYTTIFERYEISHCKDFHLYMQKRLKEGVEENAVKVK